jgi:hypothetical protein
MLIPETFDLTPAQAAAFETVADELESYGFELMRLSGRTVAIKATPADLPASEARNVLAEVLDTVDSEKRGAARATLRDEIAASLACHAAGAREDALAYRSPAEDFFTNHLPAWKASDSASDDAGYSERISQDLISRRLTRISRIYFVTIVGFSYPRLSAADI